MQKSLLLGGALGGAVLFFWSAFSWVVLPWHLMTLEKFTDEIAVAQVLTANASQPGIYILPNAHKQDPTLPEAVRKAAEEDAMNRAQLGPFLFASIVPRGWGSMGAAMGVGLLNQIVAAVLASWLLLNTRGLGYLARVRFLVMLALAVAVIAHVPYWNWWHFSTSYTLVAFLDLLIGWFLAGLVIARVVPSCSVA